MIKSCEFVWDLTSAPPLKSHWFLAKMTQTFLPPKKISSEIFPIYRILLIWRPCLWHLLPPYLFGRECSLLYGQFFLIFGEDFGVVISSFALKD